MAKAIQLRGTPAIMKAFDSLQIANWAIVYEKSILHKSAGESLEESRSTLEGFLKQLERSNTTAMYGLNFYEDIKDRKKIRISVEPDFAYNVTLFDQDEYPSQGMVTRREGYAQLSEGLAEVNARLALLVKAREEEEEEEEDGVGQAPGWLGAVNKLLDNPKIQERIGEKIIGWVDSLLSPSTPVMQNKQVGAIGNVGEQEQPGSEPITQITQDQYDKINKAVAILAGIDPHLGDHLETIAQLAKEKPKKYKGLITMLNTFI